MRIYLLIFLHVVIARTANCQCGTAKLPYTNRIVRILNGNSRATGFLWKRNDYVVTALHTIKNTDMILVRYQQDSGLKRARIVKILKKADLVLLKVEGAPKNAAFFVNELNWNPKIDTDAFAFGYYLDNERYQDRDFKVGILQKRTSAFFNTLDDILTLPVKNKIKVYGVPDVSSEIVYLKGALLHGFSGSPVLDCSGKLIGIADGGLENGAIDISWCISSRYLNELEISQEVFSGEIFNSFQNLYSADTFTDLGVTVEGGGFLFEKKKNKSFKELNLSAQYSALEMKVITSVVLRSSNKLPDYRFDIYTEKKTGYTILVPEGHNLLYDGKDFFVTDGIYKLVYHIEPSINIDNSATWFVKSTLNDDQGNWLRDHNLSDPHGIPGINSIVQRLTFVNNSINKQYIMTLAGRDKYFTVTYAICDYNPASKTGIWVSDLETCSKFVTASQLASFSN